MTRKSVLNGFFLFYFTGLNKSELEYLADPSTKSVKTSRRDFPYVMSQVILNIHLHKINKSEYMYIAAKFEAHNLTIRT